MCEHALAPAPRSCTPADARAPVPRSRTPADARAPEPRTRTRRRVASVLRWWSEWPRPDLSPSRFCVHPLGRGRAPRFCAVLRPSDALPGGPGTVSPAVRPPSDQPLPPVFPSVDTGESSQLSPRPAAAACPAASSLGVRLPRASWMDDGSFRRPPPCGRRARCGGQAAPPGVSTRHCASRLWRSDRCLH